jgi:pyruvate/2-oxoglutarate dehydrogenase complex dihydrolipoamide dehydrogenase (E3) component
LLLRVSGRLGINDDVERVRRLTHIWMPLGQRVAVVGGGLVGLELAEFLHARGRSVTVIEEGRDLAPEMAMPRRWRALSELRDAGVEILTKTRVESIQTTRVAVRNADGDPRSIEADSVVIATGTRPNPELAELLSKHCDDVRVIGDAERVGYLDGAIGSAARVAREL